MTKRRAIPNDATKQELLAALFDLRSIDSAGLGRLLRILKPGLSRPDPKARKAVVDALEAIKTNMLLAEYEVDIVGPFRPGLREALLYVDGDRRWVVDNGPAQED